MGESLPGTDGEIKMSKSLGNHIPIMAPPEDMYGKVMSVPDKAMPIYYKLILGWSPTRLQELEQQLNNGGVHPRDIKMGLAREIVTIFHSPEAAHEAEQDFIRKFQERGIPDDMPVEKLAAAERVIDLLARLDMAGSRGEAKRLIKNGGVRLDGQQIDDINMELVPASLPAVLQVGKRKFIRLEHV
jgi:tyrosyl-tRNA synthetase